MSAEIIYIAKGAVLKEANRRHAAALRKNMKRLVAAAKAAPESPGRD